MLSLHLAIAALAVSAPGLETVETRVSLLGGHGFGGQSVLLEHDWIYLKPLRAEKPLGYRPTLGLYGSWTNENDVMSYHAGQWLSFGAGTKIWGLPNHSGANVFFAMRLGIMYGYAGDDGAEGFGEEYRWVNYDISAGCNLARFHGLHPMIELHMTVPHFNIGARVGISIPVVQKLPLPAAPASSESKGPLFHGTLGAVFTAEHAGLPVLGEKWFGGQVEAGVSVYRTERKQVILGTRALAAGANPSDAWNDARPGLRTAALTLAWQDLGIAGTRLGYRVTAGGRYYTRYRDLWGSGGPLMPVLTAMAMVPTRSGYYPFLEAGVFGSSPVVLGIGRSF